MSQAQDVPSRMSSFTPNVTREGDDAVELSFDILPALSSIFSFRGRVNRTTYLLVQSALIITLVMAAATAEGILSHGVQELLTIATPLVRSHGQPEVIALFDRIGGGDTLRIVIGVCCFVAWYIIGLSVTVRRLHDFDYSGATIIVLNILSLIPLVGSIAGLIPFVVAGTDGPNQYGDPPQRGRFLSQFRKFPQHIWRGETPLTNMLIVYVFFTNFLVLDKAGTTLMSSLDLSTINLLFIGALILLNCVLAVGLWRSAGISDMNIAWRVFAKAVSVVLVVRVGFTLTSMFIAGV